MNGEPVQIRPSSKNRVIHTWEQGTILHFKPSDPMSQLRKAERVSLRANRDLRYDFPWRACGACKTRENVFVNVNAKHQATGFLVSEEGKLDKALEVKVMAVVLVWTLEACRRQGIASKLVEIALGYSKSENWAIQPPLSELGGHFARGVFGEHIVYAW